MRILPWGQWQIELMLLRTKFIVLKTLVAYARIPFALVIQHIEACYH